ncbi:MAG: malate:quinone oxidoreductase, partial [Gammaproteobacteria bacterium]
YLIKEALSSKSARIRQLQGFLPDADPEQWHIRRAGQRVQIIKPDHRNRGKLEFGTEVLATADRSMAALLGASPGASTCVSAMLDVIERCLPDLLDGEGRQKIQALIPSYGQSLRNDSQLLEGVRRYTSETLGLAPTSSQSPSERSIYA